jgi:hypothetical protein
VPPQFRSSLLALGSRKVAMKKLFVALVVACSFISAEASAQGRAGDAAIGAVSGAVVLGPVGAVAGAVIGFTAGPSISRAWGVGRSDSRSRTRRAAPSRLAARETGTQEQAAAKTTAPAPVKSSETLPAKKGAAPPVQGFD